MEAYKDAIHAYGWFYPVVEFLGMLSLGAGLFALEITQMQLPRG